MVNRLTITSHVLLLSAAVAVICQADDAAIAPAVENSETVVQGVTAILADSHPNVKTVRLLDYYQRTGPDIYAEICRQVQSPDTDAAPYVRRLADHFRKMERVRRRNPTEYERLVELEQLESRARLLGRQIQRLAEALEKGDPKEGIPTEVALARTKQQLRQVLEEAFDAAQQNQRIEINRLEAELRAMRRLLDERDVKRDLILQQRFLQLSGQPMPASEEPVAKGDPLDPR